MGVLPWTSIKQDILATKARPFEVTFHVREQTILTYALRAAKKTDKKRCKPQLNKECTSAALVTNVYVQYLRTYRFSPRALQDTLVNLVPGSHTDVIYCLFSFLNCSYCRKGI